MAIMQMQVGDIATVTCPPALAYGNRDVGPIPAGSTLIFGIGLKDCYAPDEQKGSWEKITDILSLVPTVLRYAPTILMNLLNIENWYLTL